MFTESRDECALNVAHLNVDFLYRKQVKRQIFTQRNRIKKQKILMSGEQKSDSS